MAGFDSSSGAGLTSDIKTFQAHGLYGLSVCTAITVQNDVTLKSCVWIDENIIINQIETLFERFTISVVKIGIIESWERLLVVVKKLKSLNPTVKIILDPVLQASSGFNFKREENLKVLEQILETCYFITPNYNEIKALFPSKNIDETIIFIANKINLYLKGGHRDTCKGFDEVFYNISEKLSLEPLEKKVFEKHGSGCVLSSALASNIHKKLPIEVACKNAKLYVEQFLVSNTTLLGTHKIQTE
ncbi:hydroxymethylpyrimidine/phosphomethylpyrimidine kinase [Neotamlana laminarinivorans]|uniref:hydroxymethylpyrimidine kinase n=1 Tax=Neotamlana laminarinivorans TaxID=2883124 RepID=A0A9X1I1N9_9FLAO|nr:hydroxymethylpyrimidine/phosphomethylpyrimidine kinase [Tamlana laminarinivorans]MCB4799786.1 hydroxymethylpyrimidine/phosphomethylpyrimidine kinase [Tamlana laminarinivorans]